MQKHRVVAILQVRTSSSRLPAKALLPIATLPAAVLSAKRAGNTGIEVRIATSCDPSDDQLAATLTEHGLTVHRGSLQNVLFRHRDACADLNSDDIVVRLTADNMLPDGGFIEQLLNAFDPSRFDYLGTHSPLDGLPYGLSAELFTVDALRRAAVHATLAEDLEHVTPWIRRNLRIQPWRAEHARAYWSRLRCTVDSFSDYQTVSRLFEAEETPIGVSHVELIERLASMSASGLDARTPYELDAKGRIASRLTLGAVQFGLAYGVANAHGCPADVELNELLQLAVDAGITTIDTARAYGRSESRIGGWLQSRQESRLRVITKLDPLTSLPAEAPAAWVKTAVDASVFQSLVELRASKIDTLLLHRWSHRRDWNGQAWERLLGLKAAGLISALGCSVSSPAEAIEALGEPNITHVQCPVNLLDQRWRDPRWLAAVEARPDVTVHARSVLLQGLLTLPAERWPVFEGAVGASELLTRLDALAGHCERESRIDLCIAYAASLPWVGSLVTGVETRQQLQENLRLIARPALTAAQMDAVHRALPALPTSLLDPSQWKFAHAA